MHTFLLTLLALQLFVSLVQPRPLYSLALLSLGGLEQEPVLLPDFAASIFHANREKVLALEKKLEETSSNADGSSLSIADVNDSTTVDSSPDISTAPSAVPSSILIQASEAESEENTEEAIDFQVDLNRFSQLLSVHLLFDHFENAVANLSKKVSRRFQETIQFSILYGNGDSDIITDDSINMSNEMTFDIQVLKGQIQGAVGCKFWLKIDCSSFSPLFTKNFPFRPPPPQLLLRTIYPMCGISMRPL